MVSSFGVYWVISKRWHLNKSTLQGRGQEEVTYQIACTPSTVWSGRRESMCGALYDACCDEKIMSGGAGSDRMKDGAGAMQGVNGRLPSWREGIQKDTFHKCTHCSETEYEQSLLSYCHL